MLMVGLTGGIGAGKSTVTQVFAAAGAVVVDADRIAREVVAPGSPGLDLLAAEFGDGILDDSGQLDRAALAAVAFADAERTAALNAITHPLIGERTAEEFAAAGTDAVVVHDMPLLVESGLAPTYHLVVVVHAPQDVRLERLVGQRGLDAGDARARMSRQTGDDERRADADVVIDNSADRGAATERAERLWFDRLLPFERNLRSGVPVMGDPDAVPYRPEWVDEARRAAARVRNAAGPAALRVDHVGPTSVPGLSGPDVVGLQLTTTSAEDIEPVVRTLVAAGYVRDTTAPEPLLRWCDPGRPLEITVRGDTDPEQRFALMMAEVLGEDPQAMAEYQEIVGGADREAVRDWERARCASR